MITITCEIQLSRSANTGSKRCQLILRQSLWVGFESLVCTVTPQGRAITNFKRQCLDEAEIEYLKANQRQLRKTHDKTKGKMAWNNKHQFHPAKELYKQGQQMGQSDRIVHNNSTYNCSGVELIPDLLHSRGCQSEDNWWVEQTAISINWPVMWLQNTEYCNP
jgi:hypothetical protein